MLLIGLTGSIGMGKSTCAGIFRELGIAVHDSDAAVHELYSGPAAPLIEAAFPGTVIDGVVDRPTLSKRVLGDASALKRLERIIHPLVSAQRHDFIEAQSKKGARQVVLDIPLLLERGGEAECDLVCVVSAPFHVQKQRVLARPGMTEERFSAILTNQMPDGTKRLKAHFIIDSSRGVASARQQIGEMLRGVAGMAGSAHRRLSVNE